MLLDSSDYLFIHLNIFYTFSLSLIILCLICVRATDFVTKYLYSFSATYCTVFNNNKKFPFFYKSTILTLYIHTYMHPSFKNSKAVALAAVVVAGAIVQGVDEVGKS